MLTVVATLAFSCGCTEAIVEDDGLLFACSVNICLPSWWCDCADGHGGPDMCGHADALLSMMETA
jgi:hypothetical protein